MFELKPIIERKNAFNLLFYVNQQINTVYGLAVAHAMLSGNVSLTAPGCPGRFKHNLPLCLKAAVELSRMCHHSFLDKFPVSAVAHVTGIRYV